MGSGHTTLALDGHAHRLEDLQAVGGAAGELIDGVLGVGHHAEHVAGLVAHAGDVVDGAVEVLAGRVAQDQLAGAVHRGERVGVGVVAPPGVLGGDAEQLAERARAGERSAAVEHLQLDLAGGEAQVDVAEQRAGQQVRLAQHLKAVADPEHEPAVVGELDHGLHRGREAGDGAGAQVVAVGESAGYDDRVGALEVALGVPDQLGVAHARAGVERIDLVAGAGKLKNPELHSSGAALEQLNLVVLDEWVGEQLLAHGLELRGVLDVELDESPDVDVADTVEAERRKGTLDGDALGVEDAGLRTDQDAGSHAAVRSSHAWKGSPVMRS